MPDDRRSDLMKYFADYLNTRHKLDAKEKNNKEKSEKEVIDSDFKEKEHIDENIENEQEKTKEERDFKVSPEVLAITRGLELDNKVENKVDRNELKVIKKEVKYIPPPKYISGFDKNEKTSYVSSQDIIKPILEERSIKTDSSKKKKTFMEKIVEEVLEEKKDNFGVAGIDKTEATKNLRTIEDGKENDDTKNKKTTQAKNDLLEDILLKKDKKSLTFIDTIIAQESMKDKVEQSEQNRQIQNVSENERDIVSKSEICPVCNSEINSNNKLLVCNDCGKRSCQKCEVYEKGHLKTNLYFEFKFDEPLCMSCYDKNFAIQKQLAKAYSCYGSGNYTYAYHYAMSALKIDPESKYAQMINELIEKIEERKEESQKQDIIWKEKRKMLISMKSKKEKEKNTDELN